jgi:DNA-binding MarR family transcriptional regulator
MTTTEEHPVDAGASVPRPEVAAVVDSFVTLMRSFVRVRARLMASAEREVEWSAQVLLRALSVGPMRASTLAERVDVDPSTVSRQVAALVKDGLIERRADPEDGRATLLVVTGKGAEAIREHDDIRLQYFNRMLENWSDRDLQRFAILLERFTNDYDCANGELIVTRGAADPNRIEGTP